MGYLHAFAIMYAAVTLFDWFVYTAKKAPKSASCPPIAWIIGFAAAVFELSWWCF